MAKSYEGICQLCGSWGILTDDHLPQKGLYPKKYRSYISKFNTVKACSCCNNGACEEDELLKVIIGNLAQSYWGGELWQSTISTLEKNKRLDRELEDNSRHEDVVNHDGEIETVKVLKLDDGLKGKFLLAMERIAKGLYYQEFDEVLVNTRNISVFHPDILHPEKLKYIRDSFDSRRWKSVNNDTCNYIFTELENGDVLLYLELYNSINLHYVIQRKAT